MNCGPHRPFLHSFAAVASLFDRISNAVSAFQRERLLRLSQLEGQKVVIAELRVQLAEALAAPKAAKAEIEAAKAAAATAQEEAAAATKALEAAEETIGALQAQLTADATEDAQINQLLDVLEQADATAGLETPAADEGGDADFDGGGAADDGDDEAVLDGGSAADPAAGGEAVLSDNPVA